MDELEISGKRYISSRRAGKEHKYHPDYIGQLVRAGKVQGQKVGRAWYVDADSLTQYLNQEAAPRGPVAVIKNSPPEAAPVVIEEAAPEEVTPMPISTPAPLPVHEPIDQLAIRKIIEEPEEEKVEVEEHEQKIPVRTESPVYKKIGGLTYLSDDAPLFPAIRKHTIPMTTVAAHTREVEEEYHQPTRIAEPMSRAPKVSFVRVAVTLLALGGASLALVAYISVNLIVTANVVQGQPGSVQYSLK